MEEDHLLLTSFVYRPEKKADFTRKEIRVIHLALCDYSVKEIATEMSISEKAIYKHRERIVDKTPVHSFEAVLAWVLLEKIFTPE